jgi:hypothetical protein
MKKNEIIKDEYKGTQLNSFLRNNLAGMNLARIKFIEVLICALCKARSVNFSKLAVQIISEAQIESKVRQIQRFFAEYALDTDLIAKLIFKMLPHKPPYRLTMDRTNWKFGQFNINVLTVAIVYKAVAFPILIKLLDKQGNSNTDERKKIIDRFIQLFGQGSIECLLCDREFVGERWLQYLNRLFIPYYIRIRENFYVISPRSGKRIKASWMFSNLRVNQSQHFDKIYKVNNQLCYLSACLSVNSDGKLELQIIVSFNKPEHAQEIYKDRWQIETAFKGLKSSGFNIEGTHLTDIERIEKLFSIVMLAFAWAYVVGDYLDKNIKPIKIKKHGRREKSIFRYGLDKIIQVINNPLKLKELDIFNFLSCT